VAPQVIRDSVRCPLSAKSGRYPTGFEGVTLVVHNANSQMGISANFFTLGLKEITE